MSWRRARLAAECGLCCVSGIGGPVSQKLSEQPHLVCVEFLAPRLFGVVNLCGRHDAWYGGLFVWGRAQSDCLAPYLPSL